MKIPKTAPEAPDAVVIRAAELEAIRAEIVAAEAALPALAESDDDARYEETSLAIERLKRAELRAQKRLEAAHTAHAEAEAREEQDRRRTLHDAGRKAADEATRLAAKYAEHAAEIATILKAIDRLRTSVEAANKSLPQDERVIDAHALGIYRDVVLPAAAKDGEQFWWRAGDWKPGPLDPPPPPIIKYIEFNGAFVPFDARNPAHIAARDARPSMSPVPTPKQASQPVSEFGERTLPDGTRKITISPNEWPPKPESAQH